MSDVGSGVVDGEVGTAAWELWVRKMGKRKGRRFVEKRSGQTYYVFQPYAELSEDEEGQVKSGSASGEEGYSRREWELASMGFPTDDGYNYHQHLRTIGGHAGAVFLQAQQPENSEKERMRGAAVKLRPPESVGEHAPTLSDGDDDEEANQRMDPYAKEKQETEARYWKEAERLRQKVPDLDEVLGALDDDNTGEEGMRVDNDAEDFGVDDANDFDVDDFFAQFSASAEVEPTTASEKLRAEDNTRVAVPTAHQRARTQAGSNATPALSAYELGRQARLIDEQFDRLLEDEYEDGGGSESNENDEESCSEYSSYEEDEAHEDTLAKLGGHEQVAELMQNVRDLKIDGLADTYSGQLEETEKEALKSRFQYESGSDHGETFLEMAERERRERDEAERWDCETILTTYTNLENHPSMIGIPRKARKKKVPVTAAAETAEPEAETESREQEPDDRRKESVPPVSAERHKGETAEERRLRKQAVKEQKRERRATKSHNRAVFRAENVRQATHESKMGTSKVVVQF
ncbi:Protein LTV1-like [Porphyridium purpureum]|uniref:Protein LTV1-like n=1 Tax=Porphyridium purpureum TaxID=35688 RepID=A0A5J4YQN6_PORPP|nr:Protein LTV1-like [Porphyridium purpureum]|eukprot:POR5570..scf236_6